MKMKTMDDIFLVADLQSYANPAVSLFCDRDKKVFYLLSRSKNKKDGRPAYIMSIVTIPEIIRYIDRRVRLRDMYVRKKYQIAFLDNNNHNQLFIDNESQIRKSTMMDTGKFNPEYCSDPTRIKIYLRKLSINNQY